MKRLSVAFCAILLALGVGSVRAAASPLTGCQYFVAFYEDANLGGDNVLTRCITFTTEGNPSLKIPDFGAIAVTDGDGRCNARIGTHTDWNDCISSMVLSTPLHTCVNGYDGVNYAFKISGFPIAGPQNHTAWDLTGDTNDIMSSFKAYHC